MKGVKDLVASDGQRHIISWWPGHAGSQCFTRCDHDLDWHGELTEAASWFITCFLYYWPFVWPVVSLTKGQ